MSYPNKIFFPSWSCSCYSSGTKPVYLFCGAFIFLFQVESKYRRTTTSRCFQPSLIGQKLFSFPERQLIMCWCESPRIKEQIDFVQLERFIKIFNTEKTIITENAGNFSERKLCKRSENETRLTFCFCISSHGAHMQLTETSTHEWDVREEKRFVGFYHIYKIQLKKSKDYSGLKRGNRSGRQDQIVLVILLPSCAFEQKFHTCHKLKNHKLKNLVPVKMNSEQSERLHHKKWWHHSWRNHQKKRIGPESVIGMKNKIVWTKKPNTRVKNIQRTVWDYYGIYGLESILYQRKKFSNFHTTREKHILCDL